MEDCPVGCGFRIYRLFLYRWVRPPKKNKCPGYSTKESDGEVPVMPELLGMRSTSSLEWLPGPLWPGVVAPDRVLSIGQKELNSVLSLNLIVWERTVSTSYTKLNRLKFDSELNDPKKVDTPKNQTTNQPTNLWKKESEVSEIKH